MSRLSQLDCTVTVMFTDIENSTMLAEKYGDTQWMQVLRAHNEIVRKALRTYGGNEIKSQGDGFMLAFPSARRALMCAVAIQQEVDRHGRAYPAQGVRVRIGLHTGEAIAEGGDLFGRHVILAARIAGYAEGGQILVSHLVRELVAGADDLAFDDPEEVELKGLSGTFLVCGVQWGPMAVSTLRPSAPLHLDVRRRRRRRRSDRRSAQRGEDERDVVDRRAGIDEAEPQAGLAAPCRRHRERESLAEHAVRPRGVVRGGPPDAAKQDDRELGLHEELDVRDRPR